MNRHRLALAALLFMAAPVAVAQRPDPEPANLRGDSGQTRKRLTEAEKKLQDGHAADAVAVLQQILDEAGDDLVAIDSKQHRPARWLAQQLLARLPADTLSGYRDRIEAPARKLLEAGKTARDPRPLWQLLDRYFVSRPADEGLLLLGDILFEKGEFHTAGLLWRRLLPDADADVVYPDSRIDPSAVCARLVLAAIFAGDLGRARSELGLLKQKYPHAKGYIAGKDAPYASTLQSILDSPPRIPLRANRGADWPTFGGGPDRSARVGGTIPNQWVRVPAWTNSISPRGGGILNATERPAGAPNSPPRR
ncbi:MAG TPA: hypothetical protein VLM40_06745, partial [Gemmata sp.]|nr:hypothetical protein [Gemmata sp.]